jgi:hypothetical protein
LLPLFLLLDMCCGAMVLRFVQTAGTAADVRERTAAPPLIQLPPPPRFRGRKFGLSCDELSC